MRTAALVYLVALGAVVVLAIASVQARADVHGQLCTVGHPDCCRPTLTKPKPCTR